MQLRMKIAAVAAAGAVCAALGTGAAALASSHASVSKAVTGPEVIAGAVHGKKATANSPVIPLHWAGLVTTHSVVNLGSGSGPHKGSVKTLPSPAGKLTVRVTAKPHSSQGFNNKTCRFSFTEDIPLAVVGSKSTGAFAGASGPGAVQVAFSEKAPRFKTGPKKGQCNQKGKPIVKTAVATFLASLVLTIP
jgi:hypothetical protein